GRQTGGLRARPSEPQPVIDALHYNGSPHGGPYTPELARQDGTKRDRGARGGTAVGQNGGISTAQYTSSDYTDFVHTGPETLAGRFMRRFWQPVYRAQDLLPGHAKPIRIMHEDFTLYGGEDGSPHLLDFRCAHRGTQLSTGWVEGDCIRCFYHGWKYDQTGQCVEQPAEDASFASKVKIGSYPGQEYLGLVVAYLGDSKHPPHQPLPEVEAEGALQARRY